MADWLVEEGIGEQRAILLRHGRIEAARIHWPGELAPGQVEKARLLARSGDGTRGTVAFPSGEQVLAERLPRGSSIGTLVTCRVVRAAMAEAGRRKMARALACEDGGPDAPTGPLSLAEQLRREGHRPFAAPTFAQAHAAWMRAGGAGNGDGARALEPQWRDLWLDGWRAQVDFPGGALSLHATPAMTLIDVDGDAAQTPSPFPLALAAARAIAPAIARLDLAGNMAIDFPTLARREERKALDRELAQSLAERLPGWRHERTAINGFGLVQIVSRLERVSILHRLQWQREEAALRRLLREAERTGGTGAVVIHLPEELAARIRPEFEAELVRRTGRPLQVKTDPSLALLAAFAQAENP